jgi:hypothetical protein
LSGTTRVSAVANIDVEARATIDDSRFPAVSVGLTAEPQGFVHLRAALQSATDAFGWRLEVEQLNLEDLFCLRDALNAAIDMAIAAGVNTASWQDGEVLTHRAIPSALCAA